MDAARSGLVDRYIAALRALGRIDTAQREREWRQFAAHLPMHQLRRQVLGIEVQAYGAQRHRHPQPGENEGTTRSQGMSLEKRFDAHITKGASTAPTTDELATINAMAIAPLAADDVYVVRSYLAHNAIDRDQEAFDPSLLKDFANSLPGKGLFVSHPGVDGGKGPGVGRFFAAKVLQVTKTKARQMLGQPNLHWPPDVPEDGALVLDTAAYMANTAGNADLITNLRFGVASDVSIGFRASSRSDIQDATGNVIGQRLHGPGEAYEGSLVWLGAQPGARTHKAASQGNAGTGTSEVERLKAENEELRRTLNLAYAAYERESKAANKLRSERMGYQDDSEKDLTNPLNNLLLLGPDDAPPQGAAPAASKDAELDSIGWLAKKERERRDARHHEYEQGKQAWQGDEKDLSNPLNNPLLLGSDD